MVTKRIVLVAILAVSTSLLVYGQETQSETPTIDGKSLANAIRDFMEELRANVERDVQLWRERAKQMRQEFTERLTGEAETPDGRRRLLEDENENEASESAKSLLEKGWDLVLDGAGLVKNVIETKKVKFGDFMSDILGQDWKEHAPVSWLKENFSWEELGAFEFKSNLHDFLSSEEILDFKEPLTLGDIYEKMDIATEAFCTPEEITPAEKVPTTCDGPKVSLVFVPKSCEIYQERKEIKCSPAKLVLLKEPGSCALKHYTPFSWEGKSCKLSSTFGHEETTVTVVGGDEFTVDMGELKAAKMEAIANLMETPPPVDPK